MLKTPPSNWGVLCYHTSVFFTNEPPVVYSSSQQKHYACEEKDPIVFLYPPWNICKNCAGKGTQLRAVATVRKQHTKQGGSAALASDEGFSEQAKDHKKSLPLQDYPLCFDLLYRIVSIPASHDTSFLYHALTVTNTTANLPWTVTVTTLWSFVSSRASAVRTFYLPLRIASSALSHKDLLKSFQVFSSLFNMLRIGSEQTAIPSIHAGNA